VSAIADGVFKKLRQVRAIGDCGATTIPPARSRGIRANRANPRTTPPIGRLSSRDFVRNMRRQSMETCKEHPRKGLPCRLLHEVVTAYGGFAMRRLQDSKGRLASCRIADPGAMGRADATPETKE
jgi:hypothetical protein